ncbi:uncharacterized protein LOC112572663 [Pomacea canaliculata]|uniref:uncharacterized protein LOC112572663 n=1 Tax=Pomacea canaliculata TaxID=400727 RepID=UPI000D732FEC|nr:uncharacterized protein LOC112572663 [Pomacea canaliculata]
MTTTHQLMAAAFCLCGLLFLLHVDSVNSIECKNCTFSQPVCDNGGSALSISCSGGYCLTTRLVSVTPGVDTQGKRRECGGNSIINFCDYITISGIRYYRCVKTCPTDNCNSDVNGTSVIG